MFKQKELPAIAIRGITILPGMSLQFDINRKASVQALEEAVAGATNLFVIGQKDPRVREPGIGDLYGWGCVARIKSVVRLPQDTLRISVEGISRARLTGLRYAEKTLMASVVVEPREPWPENTGAEEEAMVRGLKELFLVCSRVQKKLSTDQVEQVIGASGLDEVMDLIARLLPLEASDRQKLLEADDSCQLYDELTTLLARETEIARIRNELQQKVKERVDKNQREYLLREQMKVIQEELGEDTPMSEADGYLERTRELDADEAVKEKLRKEIGRFKSLSGNSAEASVSRTYIETLLEMPWNKMSQDHEDLGRARRILEEDHYGLDKVKERVLEFLAVRILTRKGDSPILCLAGPPGTGKTSVARSVARALDKTYVRISLGGVRDEAEIRGHRRTYIGAMPGRIAAGLRQAGVSNPLMLLDEIDKTSGDHRGDTASALLEVLDSEQNCRFRDNYIEIPLDLSQVLFIATANDVHSIPRPLLDRMEVIEIGSYTENEKYHIAREHLLPKQREHHGLDVMQLQITPGAMKDIIAGYTREAGVRQLERKIGEICRKAAREILEDHAQKVRVRSRDLEHYLGKRRFTIQKVNPSDDIGIVRGLAWTAVGGDTLQIEVNSMPGKGEIQLTGHLGDVMKESAQAGISFIRSIAPEKGIDENYFREHDIHIHIPEGAVPKDGPSAGITMATAIYSAVTMTKVRADVAMTGEITLRGRVLPIGGLKEKLLAAKNAGIRMVLVPWENRPDVAELSEEITGGLDIRYVRTMEEVLSLALAGEEEQ